VGQEGDFEIMTSFFVGSSLFLIGGVAAIFINEKLKAAAFLFFAVFAELFLLPIILRVLLSGGSMEAQLTFSGPIGISCIRLDPLAALFALIISLGSLLAAVYSVGYMKMYNGDTAELSSYYFFLGMMASSMLLVVVVQNALLFLIVWEIMSLASFFLVSFEHKKEEVRKAGIYYLIAMQIGAACLIAAFGWSSAISGSLDFHSFKSVVINSGSNSFFIFILFFLGFGTKAGFVPLHTWLPQAHPAAPTGVSALMSGVMIKMGVYGILRIILLVGIPDYRLAYGVFIISIFTALYGIANAIAQTDLKKLLAFSSIENIGIIGMGIGVGMLGLVYNNVLIASLGFFGAFLHTLNHFAFKSVLFYGAGILYSQTHTRNIEKLGGLGKFLPLTSLLFFIASLAISGMPLLNGFISEFAIFLGIAKSFSINALPLNIAALLGMSGLALIGAMSLLCFTKVYGICFLGTPRSELHSIPSEKESFLLFPMIILVFVIVMIGVFPILSIGLLAHVVGQFVPDVLTAALPEIISSITTISIATAVFICLIIFFLSVRTFLLRKRTVQVFKTWDCGYQKESSRIQYTGSSFAQPFLQLTAELVQQKVQVHKEQVLFPAHASFESHVQDFSERLLIQPTIRMLNKLLNKFSWIQSGRMQQYILYGLIFLVALLIWIWSGK
jgi:formate hydrogenlyase subunit 3/multisubunit Na+/H+ antiporter MnhD subunit